jgi:hypothetical protein
LVTESNDAVQHTRIKTVFIKAIKDRDEIQHLYQVSQARRGEEIAYKIRREFDWSSKYATRGLEISFNGKFSSDGGIQDVDFRWAKSVKKALSSCFIPKFFGPRKDNVLVNEENIKSRMSDKTGITFIPWCNGQVIREYGTGVLVKFDGFKYHQAGSSKKYTVMPVI